MVALKCEGLDAWNERFDHVDEAHFKKGRNIADWMLPEGHQTKSDIEKSKGHHKDSMSGAGGENQSSRGGDTSNQFSTALSSFTDNKLSESISDGLNESSYPGQIDPFTDLHTSPSRLEIQESCRAKSIPPSNSQLSNESNTIRPTLTTCRKTDASQNIRSNDQEHTNYLVGGDVQNINSATESPLSSQAQLVNPEFQDPALMLATPFRWGFQTRTRVSGLYHTCH